MTLVLKNYLKRQQNLKTSRYNGLTLIYKPNHNETLGRSETSRANMEQTKNNLQNTSQHKELYSTLSLFTHPVTYCSGVTLRWISIPSRGEQQYSKACFHANETGISSDRLGFDPFTFTMLTFYFLNTQKIKIMLKVLVVCCHVL